MEKITILLKNILFTLVMPGTVGGYLPLWLGLHNKGMEGWWNWLALPLLTIGIGMLLLSIWDFGKKGEGTPFPLDPPKNLVVGRLYQFSRNPMYVGVLATIAGWALWYSSAPVGWYGLTICVIFNLFVRFVEEPFLQKQFGEAYLEFCQTVPRWF